jgi:N utilization substance protein B
MLPRLCVPDVLDLNPKPQSLDSSRSGGAAPTRRRIRIRVMQALYAALLGEQETQQVYENLLSDLWKNLRQRGLEHPDRASDGQYLIDLFYGTLKHRNEFEQLIVPKLEHWDWERVAWVDRVLLLMGIYEMLHCPEIPVKVSINEYIDIAKEYSTDKSSQFVNGILDAIHIELAASNRIRKVGRGQIS